VTAQLVNTAMVKWLKAFFPSWEVYARRQRPLDLNATPAGNVGGGADDLITYTLPASTLMTTGDAVRIRAVGEFAANANGKKIEILFGSSVLYATGSQVQNGGDWQFDAIVIRTGAATQSATAVLSTNGSLFVAEAQYPLDYTTPTQTLSGAIVIKCRGTGVSTNDIIQRFMIVEFLPGA
jgi:hypothetical protein